MLVQDAADSEPLRLQDVIISAVAQQQLRECWQRLSTTTLVQSHEHLCQLVREVLSFDVRSLYQRQTFRQGSQPGTPYRLRVAGIEVNYELLSGQAVVSCARRVLIPCARLYQIVAAKCPVVFRHWSLKFECGQHKPTASAECLARNMCISLYHRGRDRCASARSLRFRNAGTPVSCSCPSLISK